MSRINSERNNGGIKSTWAATDISESNIRYVLLFSLKDNNSAGLVQYLHWTYRLNFRGECWAIAVQQQAIYPGDGCCIKLWGGVRKDIPDIRCVFCGHIGVNIAPEILCFFRFAIAVGLSEFFLNEMVFILNQIAGHSQCIFPGFSEQYNPLRPSFILTNSPVTS